MKILFTLVLLTIIGLTTAMGQKTMNIHKTNGEVISIKIDNIDYINYSEGSNASVMGSSTAESYSDLTGTWNTNMGKLVIAQTGNKVTGTYAGSSGKIWGTVSGNTLSGKYTWQGKEGTFEMNFSGTQSFKGKWKRGSSGGDWAGSKIN